MMMFRRFVEVVGSGGAPGRVSIGLEITIEMPIKIGIGRRSHGDDGIWQRRLSISSASD